MALPDKHECITREEARQIVQSLPARFERFYALGQNVSHQFNSMAFATTVAGAALTVAAFSNKISTKWRFAAAGGAIFSAGAAALLATTSYVSRQMSPVLRREVDPLLNAVRTSPELMEEITLYMQSHIARAELDSDKGNMKILEHVFCYGEEKGLLSKSDLAHLQERKESWAARHYNTGAGKQLFLSGSFN